MQILNMFNTGRRLTDMESVVESPDSELESTDSTANSATNPLKMACGYGP